MIAMIGPARIGLEKSDIRMADAKLVWLPVA